MGALRVGNRAHRDGGGGRLVPMRLKRILCIDCGVGFKWDSWKGVSAKPSRCRSCAAGYASRCAADKKRLKHSAVPVSPMQCPVCGLFFDVAPQLKAGKKGIACSAQCSRKYSSVVSGEYTNLEYTQCKRCGVATPNSRQSIGGSMFCSEKCRKANKSDARRMDRRRQIEQGKHCRGKRRKRVKANGRKYIYGITAKRLAERDGMRCQICHRRVQPHRGQGYQPRGWTVGHVIAIANGGAHTLENTQCECSECNTKKGATDLGQLSLAV